MTPKHIKQYFIKEVISKAISFIFWILAACCLLCLIFGEIDGSLLMIVIIKAASMLGSVLFIASGVFFYSLAKKYEAQFVKALKRRELRAAFKAEMNNLY